MAEETINARMERLLHALPPALRGMGFGDPDDVEYAHASDVVAWAISEIARLREERRWIPVGERLPDGDEWVEIAGPWGESIGWHDVNGWHDLDEDEDFRWEVTHWRKRGPGPEAAG
jgi:hypothetical protein